MDFRLLMLLAEALLLLVLDEDKGTSAWMIAADQGLAGALLLDLELDDRDGKLVVAGERPASAPLAAAWDVVSAEERSAKHWVSKLPGKLKPIKGTVAAGLVEHGVLDEERHKTLGAVRFDALPGARPRAGARAARAAPRRPGGRRGALPVHRVPARTPRPAGSRQAGR